MWLTNGLAAFERLTASAWLAAALMTATAAIANFFILILHFVRGDRLTGLFLAFAVFSVK